MISTDLKVLLKSWLNICLVQHMDIILAKKVLLTFTLFFSMTAKVSAYSIDSSSGAQVYEMQTCIENQDVPGCRGIMLRDVVLKDVFGNTKQVDHLFFRNMRDNEGPVFRECLDAYVSKINKYVGDSSLMNNFSRNQRALWSDPEDGSQFRFPTNFRHTQIDDNGSAYALPIRTNTEFFLSTQEGLSCSFQLSMTEHPSDSERMAVAERAAPEAEGIETTIIASHSSDIVSQDHAEETFHDETFIECDPELNQPIEDHVEENIMALASIAQRVYENDMIMTANITYGAFGINAATAQIFVETYGGDISSLSLQGDFDLLGMSGSMFESIHARELVYGQEIIFSAGPDIEPILKIVPGRNFSLSEGGALRFELWDGSQHQVVNSQLRKDENGNFNIYLNENGSTQEVDSLTANIRGFSPAGMRIHRYEVSTR
jgi:hypothetical protein